MKWKALKTAFPYTMPIFAGFWFLGMAYGIYMNSAGFSFIYPCFMSLLIFGGSLEFVAVEMLLSPFAPFSVLLMTLLHFIRCKSIRICKRSKKSCKKQKFFTALIFLRSVEKPNDL